MLRPPLGSPERGCFIFGIDDMALAIGGSALLSGVGGFMANKGQQRHQLAQMAYNGQQAQFRANGRSTCPTLPSTLVG